MGAPERKEIGDRLQELRMRAGFGSAKEFAESLGINKDTYTGYEQGKGMFTYERAWAFADALGCSLDELGGREWPPEGAGAPLAPDELEVVDSYRRTADDDKPSFIQTARTYAYAGDAKREGAEEAAELVEQRVDTGG